MYKKKKKESICLPKIILLIALAGLLPVSLYAQEQSVASLTIERCLELSKEKEQAGDIREATRFLNLAAEKSWDVKDYDKAIEYYNKSIELNKIIANDNGIAGINSNLGLIYFDKGEYETSYDHFVKTYTYRKSKGEKVAAISALINISVVLNKVERYNESIKALEEAAAMSREINDLEQMRSCYGMLSETYTKAGNTEKAADYFHLYKTVHEALLKENEQRFKTELSEATVRAQLAETERQLAETKKHYADLELLEKEKALEGLDSANRELLQNKTKAELMIDNLRINEEMSELQKKEIEAQLQNEQMKTQMLVVVLCVSFIVVIVIGFFFWQKRQTTRKLAQQNQLINRQKSELESAVSEISQKNEDLVAINDQLNRTQKALDDYQEQLEHIVVARTSKLRKALEQVRESDRFKAAFFANMSHEIRTPLNAILGFIRFIDDPQLAEEERKKMYGIIHVNANQLLRMVDDIVTLSKIDSGLISVQQEDCNISQLLDEVMAEARNIMEHANKEKLELIEEDYLSGTMPHVCIDGKKVSQILLHLIENAIKFTPYGYIRFGCEADQQEKILRFRVEDTGIGIDPKQSGLIFKRFWKQGDDAYTQEYRGLGIGLALCEELVTLMGGKISVESETDKGSVFRFSVGYK